MSDDREKDLKKRIRRFTKRIGEAKREHDFNEVENLRQQRADVVKLLIEEFDQTFAIIDGKTVFMSMEEAEEHYSDDDVKKEVGVADATNELLQARDSLCKRLDKFEKADAEDVKSQVIVEVADEIERMEKIINSINVSVGNDEIDFKAIDEKRKKNEELMDEDGFDMSSLL